MIVLNLTKKYKTFKATKYQEFPGSPVVRTQYYHCHGWGFNPWSGNQDPEGCSALPNNKKTKKLQNLATHPPKMRKTWKASFVHRLADQISLKWKYSSNLSKDSVSSLSKFQLPSLQKLAKRPWNPCGSVRDQIVKIILTVVSKVRRLTLLDFKTCYRSMVINSLWWYWYKDRRVAQWKRTWSP